MPAMSDDGTVQITLKDVYQQQQAIERTLSDSLNGLNLTMQQIRSHIEQLDTRNAAADQIHVEHASRLAKVESVIAEAQPVKTLEGYGSRIASLEKFKYLLIGALIFINAIAVFVEYLLSHYK